MINAVCVKMGGGVGTACRLRWLNINLLYWLSVCQDTCQNTKILSQFHVFLNTMVTWKKNKNTLIIFLQNHFIIYCMYLILSFFFQREKEWAEVFGVFEGGSQKSSSLSVTMTIEWFYKFCDKLTFVIMLLIFGLN